MKKKIFLGFFAGIVLMGSVQFAAAETVSCLSLKADLYPGTSDTASSGVVMELQRFLASQKFLTAVPNGYYGPGTKAGVKAFQAANGISSTGNAGPSTRAAIQKKTCGASPDASALNVVSTPTPTPALSPSIISITSPSAGETVMFGSSYKIAWNVPTDYVYNIILERKDGLTIGFIAKSGLGGNSYTWRAGTVSVAGTLAEQTVATGTYRIRIERGSGVSASSDPVSGWFSIAGQPISVTSIIPTTVTADAQTAVVLFGRGFTPLSRVYLGQDPGRPANMLYVSPDGTVLVFNVPLNVTEGTYSIFVGNPEMERINIGTISVSPAR